MSDRPRGRTLTFLAAGFLALDAILLVMLGVWLERPLLFVLGAGFAVAALAVVWLWRRYVVALGELDLAREAFKDEVERMRGVIPRQPS